MDCYYFQLCLHDAEILVTRNCKSYYHQILRRDNLQWHMMDLLVFLFERDETDEDGILGIFSPQPENGNEYAHA